MFRFSSRRGVCSIKMSNQIKRLVQFVVSRNENYFETTGLIADHFHPIEKDDKKPEFFLNKHLI